MFDIANVDFQKFIIFPFITIISLYFFTFLRYKKGLLDKEMWDNYDSQSFFNLVSPKLLVICLLFFVLMLQPLIYSYIVYIKMNSIPDIIIPNSDKNYFIMLVYVSIVLSNIIFFKFIFGVLINWIKKMPLYLSYSILWFSIAEAPAIYWMIFMFQKLSGI